MRSASADPRLLHQRHARAVDDQRGPLGDPDLRLTHGAHFIVNTAQNGRGPLLNPHPSTQGIENLCNPPDRGLGPRTPPTPAITFADAFMWTHPPGNSSGCGGGPPGGVFWPARAIRLAENANRKLGPGFPSRPTSSSRDVPCN